MKTPKHPKHTHGFTLADILIAMVILSLCLMFYLDVLVQGRRTMLKSNYEFLALTQAQQKLMTVQAGFDPLASLMSDLVTTDTVSTLPSGLMVTTISVVAASTTLRQVDIVVTWTAATQTAYTTAQATTGSIQADYTRASANGSVRLTGFVSRQRSTAIGQVN